ncbi:MAG: GLUG motif-containing protein [Planctomycetota bacterium]|jgi:hypothetical protein
MAKKTVILSIIISFLLLTSSTFAKYSGGTGEPNNPFQIATPNDLNDIGNHPNDWDKHFILINDINMVEYTYTTAVIAPDINDVSPGFQGTQFTGVFDGNDCNISNLTIDTADNDCLGLFGYIGDPNAKVKNLDLENVTITGEYSSVIVGGLCGFNYSGTISNCYATASVTGGDYSDYLGGLCGYNYSGTIRNCYATASVTNGTGSRGLGGLCGYNRSGTINNCYATGSITGGYNSTIIGGLCGGNHYGTISNCYATASVTGGDYSFDLGGLCGRNRSGTINNCYATGSITGGYNSYIIGGLCGGNYDGMISDCFASGFVTGYDNVGGLCGLCGSNNSTIENCYAVGDVNGVSNVGGLIGEDDTGEYTASFWDSDINPDVNGIGNAIDPNVIGKTTTQMKTKSTFTDAGWDFVNETTNGTEDIWAIKEDVNYSQHVWPLVQYVNWDGVDFLDYAFFANYYGMTDCNDINDCNSTDLDFSGAVDINDVNIFTNYWMFGK